MVAKRYLEVFPADWDVLVGTYLRAILCLTQMHLRQSALLSHTILFLVFPHP